MNRLYILEDKERYYSPLKREALNRSIFRETNPNNISHLFGCPMLDGYSIIGGCFPRRGIKLKRKLSGY